MNARLPLTVLVTYRLDFGKMNNLKLEVSISSKTLSVPETSHCPNLKRYAPGQNVRFLLKCAVFSAHLLTKRRKKEKQNER